MDDLPDVTALAGELSSALMNFHRTLIIAEAGDDPKLQNPYTLLFAVIGDPRFSWTNGLSQLIVRLDEMRKEGEIAVPGDLLPFREELERLLGERQGEDAEFRLHYLIAMQKAPDVALATGQLRRVLAMLPKSA
ncbi:hypothetical protein L598_000800001400 [Mesorhizobium sp. J18]|uniref:hypothetical protein n=1 Tax=Mesorhizobium sp. J18 TaxID=935263 RepID=UPI00119B42AB|nr:hypothetical protein [Mesorhizobium sp. J18]TWG89676.1 hypothetical protein L598_000800001400 [Mesorhizobium sp. J18]